MKRYFCDRCDKEINIDSDGYEDFMLCAKCANEVFGQLDGMEGA